MGNILIDFKETLLMVVLVDCSLTKEKKYGLVIQLHIYCLSIEISEK